MMKKNNLQLIVALALMAGVLSTVVYGATLTEDFDDGALDPYVSVIGAGPIIRDPNQAPWSAGADGELYVDGGNNYNSKADFGVDLGSDFEFSLTMRPYLRNNTQFQMALNTATDGLNPLPAGALRIKIGIQDRIGYDGLAWDIVGGGSGGANFGYAADMVDGGEMRLLVSVSGGNSLTIKKQIIGVDAGLVTVVDGVAISGMSSGHITFTTLESQAQIDDLVLVKEVICPPLPDPDYVMDFNTGVLGPYVSVIGAGPIIRDPNHTSWSSGADGELYVDGGNNYNSKVNFGFDLGGDFEFGLTMRPYLRNNTHFQMLINTNSDTVPEPEDPNNGALRIKVGIPSRIGYNGLSWEVLGSASSGGADFDYETLMSDDGEIKLWIIVSGGNTLTIKKQIVGVDDCYETVVDGVVITDLSTTGFITFTTLESQAQIDDLVLVKEVICPPLPDPDYVMDFNTGALGSYVSVIGAGPIIRDPGHNPWSSGADGELYVDGGNNYNSKVNFGFDLGGDFEFGLTMRPYLRNNTHFQMLINTNSDTVPEPEDPNNGALRIKVGIPSRIGYNGLSWEVLGSASSGGADFDYETLMSDDGEIKLWIIVSGGNTLTIKKQIVGVDNCYETIVDAVAITGLSTTGYITFTTLESQAQIDDLVLVKEPTCPSLPTPDYIQNFDDGTLNPYVSVIGAGPIIRDPGHNPWSSGADGELYVDGGNNYNSKVNFGFDLGGDFEFGLTMRPYLRNNTHFQMLINTNSDTVPEPEDPNNGALRIKVGIPSRIGYNGLSWEVLGSASSGGADFDYETLMSDDGEIKLWIIVSGGNTLTIKKQIVGVDGCYETIVDAVAITGLSTTGYITFTTLESQAQIDDLFLVGNPPPVSDLDENYRVDWLDFAIFASHWLEDTRSFLNNHAQIDSFEITGSLTFTDDFSNAIADEWSIEAENADYYSTGATYLDVCTTTGAFGEPPYPVNLFWMDLPSGDFVATLKLLNFEPTGNSSQVTLTAYSDSHSMTHARVFYVYHDFRRWGLLVNSQMYGGFSAIDFGSNPFWLRLKRVGDNYTASYSTNGTTFVETSSAALTGMNKIGFMVGFDRSTCASPIGDLDGDCFVGIEDLRIFASQWLEGTN